MKLTKYQHACFTVEKDGRLLVIDPGNFSTDFIAPDHVDAIVVTHQHPDHFDHNYIADIIDKNPDAIIIGPQAVTSQIEAFESRSAAADDMIAIGPFNLEFFGGEHTLIHESIPKIANLGVMIDDLLYYPGDSFTLPGKPVDTLALPAAAPWMKIGDAMDFLRSVQPRLAFPTHDAILSDIGKALVDGIFNPLAKENSIQYRRLDDTLEI